MEHKVCGIILMGGKGERFGSERPKQLHRLAGEPVFMHTLKAFLAANLFSEVLLVCPKEWIEEIKRLITPIESTIPLKAIEGGATRRDSSHRALYSVSDDTTHVVIHDAVRPFVSQKILQDNVAMVKKHGAVDTCIGSFDTIVYSKDGSLIDSIPDRAHCLRGQTPQSFSLDIIKKAHQLSPYDVVTDDCSLVKRMGAMVYIVEGDERNIKITTELDLYLAEQLLRKAHTPSPSKSQASVQGKTFIVTGATGAIGSSISRLLQDKGAHVIAMSRSSAPFSCDLSSKIEASDVFKKIYEEHGEAHGLINSVGTLKKSSFKELDQLEIDKMVEDNLYACLYSCYFARIKPKGHIINISSSSYSKGRRDTAVYSACKAAIVNFTQALSEEMQEHYVNVICPQRTKSPMRQKNFPEELRDSQLSPIDIAHTVLEMLENPGPTGTIFEVKEL